jgi:1-phosphofructokinase family hexose kinase
VIICISANPAIDRRIHVPSLSIGGVNRALDTKPAPGGKAAHVALAAKALGESVIWAGFLGGATGEECRWGLEDLGIPARVVQIAAVTRVNLEIIESDGRVTEVLEPGGAVTDSEVSELLNTCGSLFQKYAGAAYVVISGSLPPGARPGIYAELIELAHASECEVALDTSGAALTSSLKSSPDLIKPNRDEATAAFGAEVRDYKSAYEAALTFNKSGAQGVALSLGTDGLLWLPAPGTEPLVVRPPVVKGRSAVGCGDATMAGFAVATMRRKSSRERAVLAAACGAANCLADSPGMIKVDDVERLIPQVEVEELFAADISTPSDLHK